VNIKNVCQNSERLFMNSERLYRETEGLYVSIKNFVRIFLGYMLILERFYVNT
jgi:hypothetical protein